MKDEAALEAEIQSKGLNAPRLTPAMIDAVIVGETYWNPEGTTLTVCVLTLRNGFTVTGESAAASPSNFDVEIGKKIARENARGKIWALEGYALRERIGPTGIERTARRAHEANRGYCLALGDTSQVAWEDAPQWQRDSAIKGVQFIIDNPGASPAASHENWLEEKRRDGWKYGPVKDAEAKTHPCFVPYDELPVEQRAKDYIFGAVVRASLR
jgi:hypothetical protein